MSQSHKISLIEAGANVTLGYLIAVATQGIVFPLFGLKVSLSDNLAISAVFTGLSLLRSYALRRAFERWSNK